MRYYHGLCLALLLCVTACATPQPISVAAMQPKGEVYNQTTTNFYLKNKIAVGDFEYVGTNKENNAVVFSNFSRAVNEALTKGGYITKSANPPYVLTGKILEVSFPRCIFGSCESGAAVEYTLTSTQTHRVVFNQQVVVPYTMECPVFMNDATPYIRQAYYETIGNNIAQLIQILNRKTSSQL